MIGYIEAMNTLHTRGYTMDANDYMFALMIVVDNPIENAYAFAYDREEMNRHIGTESEDEYFSKVRKDAEVAIERKNISHIIELLKDSYRAEIQKKALDLKDYKFSGEETVQILNNLLKTRVEDIESSSVRDIVSIIKSLTDQGALEVGDGGYQKHFIQIFPKFNALCPICNRETDIARGMTCFCSRCGAKFTWVEEENRFYPNVEHL